MITPVCRLAALCVLGAVLTACGADTSAPALRPRAARPSPSASPAPSRPPTLAPGPAGLTPVFENGPRTLGRTVALTFDADMTADQGPRAAAGEHFDNPGLISALRELKVPATVFMTGRWAEEYPDQARSIGRDPRFEIANHSYSHYAFTDDCYGLPTVSEDRMRADVERAYKAFRKAGVVDAMPYFRFPGGCYDRRALRAVGGTGVTAVQWDVVSGDAFATDADAVARQVLDGVGPGSVVVMHCTRSAAPTTERAVRTIVPELRRRGYRFVKVSELIGAAGGRR
ncbi:polysaccharide deacetylase family protein [Streptomyces sp. NPDC002588]|uniref:polysaccharide deacetylase family protein n=1 Tax=Streptomyces sp. NPDC002588 TaxID=3154419 RepID=UPI0033243AE0